VSTAIRHVTPRRLTLVLVAIMVGATIAYSGYLLGEAASPPTAQDYKDVVSTMDEPVDGGATVFVDQTRGVVCAKTRQGRGMGASCTSLDSTVPMVMESGGALGDPVHIVVVDPQRRLGTVIADSGAQAITAASSDGGLSIDVKLPTSPDTITVLDRQGNVLDVAHPKAQQDRARREAQRIQQSAAPGNGH